MEKLDISISHETECKHGSRKTMVGNTGLVLWHHTGTSSTGHIDFTPEGNCEAVRGMEKQYALMFLGALAALTEWAQCEDKNPLPKTIEVSTNPKMGSFIRRHLGPAVTPIEENIFQVWMSINSDILLNDREISIKLLSAQRQVIRANYYVDDPCIA